MDNALYTALSGATRSMETQRVYANNLANMSTPGFRADYLNAMAQTVPGEGFDTRVQSRIGEQWTDMNTGPLARTDQPLDLAIEGEGWFSVQDANGEEAYTRAGSLRVDGEGVLRTATGLVVVSDAGPAMLPPFERVEVGSDGRISVKLEGAAESELAEVSFLKLVNPPADQLSKGDDGLFRLPDGAEAPIDPEVSIVSGYLEGSNVNAVKEMVSFINLSRNFEMQLKVMRSVETVAEAGDRMLRA